MRSTRDPALRRQNGFAPDDAIEKGIKIQLDWPNGGSVVTFASLFPK